MFPEWMTPVEGTPGFYLIDPDIFYPMFLKEMGVDEAPNRNQLEVAYGCMKLDANRAARLEKKHLGNRKGCTFLVRGDDGRKLRWNYSMHPEGALDISSNGATALRNREVRTVYRRLRGV